MKILLISPRYYPIFNNGNHGAIEKLEQIYLKYNENTNDYFTVYSPKIASDDYDNPGLKRSDFRIIDLTTKKYKMTKYLFAMKRILLGKKNNELYIRKIAKDIVRRKEQDKYDLIIFENGEQDIPVFKRITKTTTPIVLHLHNNYINRQTKDSEKVIDSVNEFWVVSDYLAKQIKEVKNAKTLTIPNTIDTNTFKQDGNRIKKLSKQFRSDDNKIFIFVGRILELKGILQLLEAFERYNKKDHNSKLLIAGMTEKNTKGKKLRNRLAEYCSRNSNIQWLGYVEPADLINYEAVADCQVIPSMCEEAFGLVVLEAMNANLKIIASNVGGIPEVGEDRIMYVNRENIVNDLIKSMVKIDKTKKLPSNYYRDLLEKYTVETYCQNIYSAIHYYEANGKRGETK